MSIRMWVKNIPKAWNVDLQGPPQGRCGEKLREAMIKVYKRPCI